MPAIAETDTTLKLYLCSAIINIVNNNSVVLKFSRVEDRLGAHKEI